MKKYIVLSLASLLFVGCGQRVDKFDAPKFPENALVTLDYNVEGLNNCEELNSLTEHFRQQSLKIYEDNGIDASELTEYAQNSRLADKNVQWAAFYIESFQIPARGEKLLQCPAMTFTISSKKSFDVDKELKAFEHCMNVARKLLEKEPITLQYTKTNENGCDLWRIEISDEVKNECDLPGIDIVLSTANNGKVLHIASSVAALAKVRALYDGTEKALPYVRELDKHYKIVTHNLRAFLDAAPDAQLYTNPEDGLQAIEGISIEQYATNNVLSLKISAKYNSESVLKKQFDSFNQFKVFFGMFLQPAITQKNPEFKPAFDLINGIMATIEDSSLVINFPIPFETLREFDFEKISKIKANRTNESGIDDEAEEIDVGE